MPLLYSRVWFWLLGNVNHQDNETIINGQKYSLKAGQKLTSLQHIAEAVAYPEWGKLQTPNKKTIHKICQWLESNEMVTVESNGLGTVISICNWQDYQAEKVTNDGLPKVTNHSIPLDTNKNDKNDKNIYNSAVSANETTQGNAVKVPTYIDKAREILDHLNNKVGTKQRKTEEIMARLREGYTVEDFKTVIDNKLKDPFFIEHPKFYRTDTLFCKKHFDAYLNEHLIKAPQKKLQVVL